MARSEKYTNEQIIAALAEMNGAIYLAAKKLHCDPATIHRRAQRSPDVKAAIENERGAFLDTAELKLYQAVVNGEAWAICFTLKTQGKGRGYVERGEITGRDGGPIEHSVTLADVVSARGRVRDWEAERFLEEPDEQPQG